jgi:hypothetical protein
LDYIARSCKKERKRRKEGREGGREGGRKEEILNTSFQNQQITFKRITMK